MKIDNVLLGVADVALSVAFYEALGFKKASGGASMAVLADGETRFAVVERGIVSKLLGKPAVATEAPSSVLLGRQCRSQEDVIAYCAKAKEAGATIVREPSPNDWGGYSGAFTDPDGHVWNVGFNLLFYRS